MPDVRPTLAKLRAKAEQELARHRAEVARLEGFLTTLDALTGDRTHQKAVGALDQVATALGLPSGNGAAPVPPPSRTLRAFVAAQADWTAHPTPEINRLMAAWLQTGRTTTRRSVAYAFRQARSERRPASRVPANDPINTVLRTALLEGPQRMSALTARLAEQHVPLKRVGLRTRLLKLGAQVKGRSHGATWSLPRSARG